jgi:hypothetical protein
MTRRIAPEALIALEFRGLPFHDPFHGQAVDRRWPPQQSDTILLPNHTDSWHGPIAIGRVWLHLIPDGCHRLCLASLDAGRIGFS